MATALAAEPLSQFLAVTVSKTATRVRTEIDAVLDPSLYGKKKRSGGRRSVAEEKRRSEQPDAVLGAPRARTGRRVRATYGDMTVPWGPAVADRPVAGGPKK